MDKAQAQANTEITNATVEADIGARARVTLHVGETPPLVANRGRIAQVVTNLLVNAAQAIEAHGRDGEDEIAVFVDEHEGGTLLAVEDTGLGIEPSIRHRVFEPFFTTKGDRDGTGLGLAIVAQIVASYQGTTRVGEPSGSRRGARVEVWFPPSRPAA